VKTRMKTIAMLGTLVLVGAVCVAMASIALARGGSGAAASAGYVDLASGSQVVWGSDGDGVRRAAETTPVVSGLDPDIKAVGSSGFMMMVSGSSFVSTSTVLWNGGALGIVPGSLTATSVRVSVPAANVGTVKPVHVTVKTGLKASTPVPFTITQPTIAGVAPAFVASTVTTATITLTGTHLRDGLDAPHLALKGTGAIIGTTITGITASATANSTMVGVFNLATPIVAPAGVYDVVLTYGASGLVTKAAAFAIYNPVPTVTTISPTTVYAKSAQSLALTVNGTGFVSGAGGSAIKIGTRTTTNTTFVSVTQLTVPLTAADIAAAATVPITVVNPAPGGGPSNVVNLTVAADTTAPVTTIAGADSAWHTTLVMLTVTAIDAQSGVQTTQYDVNGAAPITLVGSTITVPADGTSEGENVVNAWSTDWSGNVETPAPSVTVKIDTVKPIAYGKAATGTHDKKITLKYKITDNVSPKVQSIYVKITKTNGDVVKTVNISGQKTPDKWYSFTWKPGSKGTYNYYVHGEDLAGNTSTTSPAKITVK